MKKVLVTKQIDIKDISYANSLSLDIDMVEAISFEYDYNRKEIEEIFSHLDKYDLIFTSVNAVISFKELLHKKLIDKNRIGNIFCVGTKTSEKIAELGFDSIIPDDHNADALADLILTIKTNPLVYFRGNLSREIIFKKINAAEREIYEAEVYQTVLNEISLKISKYDAIMFFSPSAVKAIAASNEIEAGGIKLFAIGNTTASALEKITNRNIFISDKQDTTSFLKFVSENL